MPNKRPRIAITPGEPAGIGLDLVLSLANQSFDAELTVIADPKLLQERAKQLKINFEPNTAFSILPVSCNHPITLGTPSTETVPYILETLTEATKGCLAQTFDAMVTGPIQKDIINRSGIAFTGHTEFLANLTNTPRVVMMLATDNLRVALATTHLPLSEVPAAITQESLETTLQILHHDLQSRFSIDKPQIHVCGLNPHAGENGYLGSEEITTIIPVLEKLRAKNFNLTGPLPADTAFTKHHLKNADAVLAMYHDQGLPVLKHQGFGEAVNITLGLPIIRTSVDHGTALSLAGTGKADPSSLLSAINMAINIVNAARTK